jgi:hypothetical protein
MKGFASTAPSFLYFRRAGSTDHALIQFNLIDTSAAVRRATI